MFHEASCKTKIDPERLIRLTPKTAQNIALAKTDPQQQGTSSFVNEKTTWITEIFKEAEYLRIPKMVGE